MQAMGWTPMLGSPGGPSIIPSIHPSIALAPTPTYLSDSLHVQYVLPFLERYVEAAPAPARTTSASAFQPNLGLHRLANIASHGGKVLLHHCNCNVYSLLLKPRIMSFHFIIPLTFLIPQKQVSSRT
mmetsp:Transcript_34347/g.73159  ORF Transcript_34347/g.73159 Transcript_34347/m.73159 type:complete len:127 (-) Transcript_34347:87-467(-)